MELITLKNPIAIGIVILVLVYIGIIIYNQFKILMWKKYPNISGNIILVQGKRVFVRIKGSLKKDTPLIILEPGAGMSSYFMWDLQDKLAEIGPVLTYDRKGLGWSETTHESRQVDNLVRELLEILKTLNLNQKIFYVGHSLAGIIGFQLVQSIPDSCIGLVQLDPVPFDNYRFQKDFSEKIYRYAIDKTSFLKYLEILAKFQVLRLFSIFIVKMFPKTIRSNLVNEYTRISFYKIARNEFDLVDESLKIAKLNARKSDIPLLIIAHDRNVHIDYYRQIGEDIITTDECDQLEDIFEKGYNEYASYFNNAMIEQIEGTSHSMFLEKPDIIAEKVKSFYKSLPNK